MDSKKIGLILGPAIFITMLIVPAPYGMEVGAWRVAAIALLMATWWITEAVPIAATAMLPIVLYPILQIMGQRAATASYSDPVIYLFMGGFFLAVTMERWNLHRRIALNILRLAGDTPSKLILGFIGATTFLSMWISNTATAVMMVPIGISVVSQVMGGKEGEVPDPKRQKYESNFAKSLVLAIAYTASIGGFITIIGTPTNIIMAGILDRNFDIQVGFAQWMMLSVPISLTLLACMYFLLTKVLFPTGDLKLASGKKIVDEEMEKLGPMSSAEKRVLLVGSFMALNWIFRDVVVSNIDALAMITDTTVAITGTLLLFLCPAGKDGERLLNWETAVKIPWSVVLLFGGGLTLASGFEHTGLATWVSGNLTGLTGMHILLFVFIIVLIVNTLTEFMSNTAIATLFIPVMGATAIAMGFHPFTAIVATTITSTFSFMMPVATPPNAIAFGSGYLKISDMAKTGIILNIIAQLVCVIAIVYLLPLVWNVDLTVVPPELLIP